MTCNFEKFYVYDMERPGGEPEKILLKDLPKEYHRLQFLVDMGNEHLKREMEVSMAAGEIVDLLYDAFAKQYRDPTSKKAMHSLNVLCVRLVFCLYAEDAGIFGRHGMFHDYLAEDNPELAAFPYVNGGLFSDEDIEIPPFTDEIRELLLNKASTGFDCSEISPTILALCLKAP